MALTKITSDVIETGAITSDKLASGAVSASSLSSITTDNVSEGSTNTYFTNARARGSISVTGGNLSYDSGTGVIQLTTDQIRTAVSGGTGVSISAGEISIGQDVATSSTPTFGNITTTGYIAGPATFTIDPAAVGDNTGTVVIAGNLQVDGTTTTINSTTMEVDDLNITLASGAANAAAANGAGITVDGASATLLYQSTPDAWSFNKNVGIGTTDPSGILDIYKNSVMDINLRGNPPELNLEDLGGTSGQKRGRLTVDSNKLSIQGLSDDDASVTYNFVDFRLDNGGVQFYGDFPDGSQNVAFGASAGAALTSTGNRNVLLGSRAGMSVTSGDHNVFVGSGTSGSIRGAGELTDTGVENVGIGTGALGDNVSGGYNTAVGHMSMYYNGENSSSNIAVGVNAMLNGGGGGSNVAVGINALKQVGTSSGDSNTAINFEALEDLTTGNHNIGIGYRAGMNLQSGSYNIIIGNNSHNSATGGNYNIVLGYGASTATGSRNLIVGYDAGTNMTSGSNNTLINFSGDSHGIDIASKSNHTVIGGGDMMPAFHNYVHEDTAFGNIDVTHNGTSENFITAGAGATVPLFTGGNSFSGIFMINDFTRTGDMYLIMTGGGSISIIAQTGGTLVTSSSPGSLQYGIYLSSLGVMFKNGTSSSFNFRLIAFRTRAAQ